MALCQAKLEWRLQVRRPFVWLCLVLPFAIAFFDTLSMAWEPSGQLAINGPGILTIRSIIYSILGGLLAAGIVGETACRDRVSNMEPNMICLGLPKFSVAVPRITVGFLILLLSTSMFIPAIILVSNLPGIRPDSVVVNRAVNFFSLIAIFVAPNLLFATSIAYVAGSIFRNRTAPFLAIVFTISLYVIARMLLGVDVYRHELFSMFALIDPYGSIALAETTNHWTVDQQNQQLAPLQGWLMANRLLWLTVSCIVLILGIAVSATRLEERRKSSRWWPGWVPIPIPSLGRFSTLNMIFWEWITLLRTPAVWIVLGMASLNLWWVASSVSTHGFSLPTTDLLLHNTNYYFDKCLIFGIAWASASLIYGERQANVDEFMESLPVSDGARFLSKLAALLGIVGLFWLLSIVVNVLYQCARGFYDVELPLHFFDTIVVRSPYYLWMAGLSYAIQVIARNRYVGIAIFLILYASEVGLTACGIHNPLFRIARTSFFYYSLMDGYGHFLKLHCIFLIYWTAFVIAVLTLAWCTYSRGRVPRGRFEMLKHRLATRRWTGGLMGACFVSMAVIAGTLLFVNRLNHTWPPIDIERLSAQVEELYGPEWKSKNQPKVVEIQYDVDIDPEDRSISMRGELLLENQGTESIIQMMTMHHPLLQQMSIDLGTAGSLKRDDLKLRVRIYALEPPLSPGEQLRVRFHSASPPGRNFAIHSDTDTVPEVSEVEVVGNGTSLLNLQFMPFIGYNTRVELKPKWLRRKHGLLTDWSPPNAEEGKRVAHDASHLGWIRKCQASLSTNQLQTILHGGERSTPNVPGTERVSSGAFSQSRPVRGWSQILSGSYECRLFKRARLPDVELYFHHKHNYVVDHLGKSLLDAIEYFQSRYGQPPFTVFRMAENSLHYDVLGAHAGLGYSSEVIGWKTDMSLTQGSNLDELAAQLIAMAWWGDQIIPANVEGAKVIHSGLPYWTASLYLYRTQSPEKSRQLRFQAMQEMFRARSKLNDIELPFTLEFKDSTMIRKKGSIQILYLAERFGIDRIEEILSSFLDRWRFQGPPYATAEDLLEHLLENLPADALSDIKMLMRETNVWNFRVVSVNTEREGNAFRIRCEIEISWNGKTSNTESSSTPAIPTQLVAFRGFGYASSDIVEEQWKLLPPGRTVVEWVLNEMPTRIGVDPYLLLPDTHPIDNVLPVRK